MKPRAGQGAGDHPVLHLHPPRLLRRVQLLRHRRPRRAHRALAQPAVHPGRGRTADSAVPISRATSRMWAGRPPTCTASSATRNSRTAPARTNAASSRRSARCWKWTTARRSSCCASCASCRASRRSSWPPASATTWCWPTRSAAKTYLQEIVEHHVSGQLKVAPEHTEEHVLDQMGKPGTGIAAEVQGQIRPL